MLKGSHFVELREGKKFSNTGLYFLLFEIVPPYFVTFEPEKPMV